MRRGIIATRADGAEVTYPSIREALETLHLHPPTIHRALWHRKPLNKGPFRGWKFRYADTPVEEVPEVVETPPEPGPYDGYPISRYDALEQGAAYYYTGFPCKRGHIALRKTQGACTECLKLAWSAAKEARKPYFEEYRKRPEVIARTKAYYENIRANKAAKIPVEAPAEIPAREPNPTYKELMEQARVKPRA